MHEKVVWLLTSQGFVGDELDWRKRWCPPPDSRCLFDHLIGEQHRGTSRPRDLAVSRLMTRGPEGARYLRFMRPW
jgi:hypothetical protein